MLLKLIIFNINNNKDNPIISNNCMSQNQWHYYLSQQMPHIGIEIIIMNVSIDKIKAFCRNNSVSLKGPSNIPRYPSYQRSLNRLHSASTQRNLLFNHLISETTFILIYIKSMNLESSIAVKIGNDQKGDTALVKDGNIFYNGQETSIKVEKTKPFLLIFKTGNQGTQTISPMSASVKIMGKVEIGKIKSFQSEQTLNKYIIRIINKQQSSSMVEVIRINWNELQNKRIKHRKNSGNKFTGLRRLRSFNEKRSSHNTSTSHTTNIPEEKRNLKNIMYDFKTLELDKFNKGYMNVKMFDKPKNYSEFVGKKKQDYTALYNSLRNHFPKNVSTISGANPRTKEDIDKVYDQEKKRFNIPEPIITNESQAIEEDIHHFRKYSDSEFDNSFEGEDGIKKMTQSQESGLVVSEYM